MANLKVREEDIQAAVEFMVQYMAEKVPEATFSEGSAVRDLAVKPFAAVFAFLQAEAARTSVLQSLSSIQTELANSESSLIDAGDVNQAVNSIMSNWFVTRANGRRSAGNAQLHFTQRTAAVIRRNVRFWRTGSLAFYPDTTNDYIAITENQLRPTFNSRGQLIDYVATIPIVAARTGDSYDVGPGRFIRVEASDGLPNFSYAENQQATAGGASTETSEDLIARAETSISVRNMINNRSVNAVFPDVLPEVANMLTVGMGEPEMVRDRRTEFYPAIEMHIGGHYDTYLDLPEVQVEEVGMVGGLYPRADGKATVFRDPALTHDAATRFTDLGILPGHILYLVDGVVGAPRGFPIVHVTDHTLHVSENTPFDAASDEQDVNEVLYSVGWFAPSFSEVDFGGGLYSRVAAPSVDPLLANIPAGTSRRLSASGCIFLSGRPVTDVLSVELTDPDPSALVDPSTGTLRYTTRVNGPPVAGTVLGTSQYQVECWNPKSGQSMESVYSVRVGPLTDIALYDGKNLRVAYRTLRSFGVLHAYVRNYNNRVVAASHLVRGRNPIWVYATIPYRMRPNATAAFPMTEAQRVVSSFINAFDPNDDLDMSDIATSIREEYVESVGTVFPFTIEYDFHLPDGQVLEFETTDIVSVFPRSVNGVSLMNSADVVMPAALVSRGITEIRTDDDLYALYHEYGISDRTVSYGSRPDLITFILRG